MWRYPEFSDRSLINLLQNLKSPESPETPQSDGSASLQHWTRIRWLARPRSSLTIQKASKARSATVRSQPWMYIVYSFEQPDFEYAVISTYTLLWARLHASFKIDHMKRGTTNTIIEQKQRQISDPSTGDLPLKATHLAICGSMKEAANVEELHIKQSIAFWRLLNWYKYNHWFQARLYRLQAKVILRIFRRKLLSTRFPSTQSLQTSWLGSIRVNFNLYAGCSDIFWKLYTLDLTWAIEHHAHIRRFHSRKSRLANKFPRRIKNIAVFLIWMPSYFVIGDENAARITESQDYWLITAKRWLSNSRTFPSEF